MVKNLDKLQARLRAMPEKVQAAARAEMEKTAKQIVSAMKMAAPVETGALRDSIAWTWGAAPEGSMAVGTVDNGSGLVITIHAGNDRTMVTNSTGGQFQLARLMEFGTKDSRVPAHPYFFPAIRTGRRGFVGRVNRAAIREMKKVWGQ